MTLYAVNNPNRRIEVFEGLVKGIRLYEKPVKTNGYREEIKPFTQFFLEYDKLSFSIPGTITLWLGTQVKLYEDERFGNFVKLAGLEALMKDGNAFFKRKISGYEFRD